MLLFRTLLFRTRLFRTLLFSIRSFFYAAVFSDAWPFLSDEPHQTMTGAGSGTRIPVRG